MKAYMVATGDYEELANITSRCLEWASGLSVQLIREVAPIEGLPAGEWPFAAKLLIPDLDQHLVADADLVFLRKFKLPDVPLGTVAGARAEMTEDISQRISDLYNGGPLKGWINTGLFVSDGQHTQVKATAVEWMKSGISKLHEESFFNAALHANQVPIQRLPLDLNRQVITCVYSTGLHLCGCRGLEAKLKNTRFMLKNHAPSELQERLVGLLD